MTQWSKGAPRAPSTDQITDLNAAKYRGPTNNRGSRIHSGVRFDCSEIEPHPRCRRQMLNWPTAFGYPLLLLGLPS
jgi:hypothetical protein